MIRRFAGLPFVAVALTGCLESVEPEPVHEFSGPAISGQGDYSHISFQAGFAWFENQNLFAAIARVNGDTVDPAEEPLPIRRWAIHQNSCAIGGTIIGEAVETFYPLLQVNTAGNAIRETSFSAAIDVTGDFHAKLYASSTDDTVIACMDLDALN